jgi:hypothetical protein
VANEVFYVLAKQKKTHIYGKYAISKAHFLLCYNEHTVKKKGEKDDFIYSKHPKDVFKLLQRFEPVFFHHIFIDFFHFRFFIYGHAYGCQLCEHV